MENEYNVKIKTTPSPYGKEIITGDMYADYYIQQVANKLLDIYSMLYVPDDWITYYRWGFKITLVHGTIPFRAYEALAYNRPECQYFRGENAIIIYFPTKGEFNCQKHNPNGGRDTFIYPSVVALGIREEDGDYEVEFFPSAHILFGAYANGLVEMKFAVDKLHDKVKKTMGKKGKL